MSWKGVLTPFASLHPTRISWKGGSTWISREVTLCNARDGDSSLASPHTQPGYPGRVGQPGYPGRPSDEMRGTVIRPLHRHTQPGYPGRVGPPGYPGGSSCVTRHPTPNQDVLERWTNLDIQGG